MSLTKYKIKISIFITSVIFLLFFLAGVGFLIYDDYIKFKEKVYKLQLAEDRVRQLKIKKLVCQLNEISIMNIVSSALSENNYINKEVKKLIGVPFIHVEKNKDVIFKNFSSDDCGSKFFCRTFRIKNYRIILATTKVDKSFRSDIIIFLFFSIIVSLLFFPFIFWIVGKLTKPIVDNFEFMKNFINNAGHELKTPLANINLGAQILLKQDKFNKSIVESIERESKRLGFIVDTLLELSSINKFQNKEEVNIKDIVGSVLEKYHDKIKDFNINIKLDDVKLWVNKYQFEMLFENLLKNAINYNNEKKRIEIVLNKNYLDIKNTTNKLPNFSKIFDLFYKERSSGYGLGLAIVKRIVDINKWKIINISKKDIFGIKIKF